MHNGLRTPSEAPAPSGPAGPRPSSAPAPKDPASVAPGSRHDFAVVIPAYNEAPNFPELVLEVRAAFETHGLGGDVIIVDDGSTDGTGDLAQAAASDWDKLTVLRHRTNRGKTEALLTAAAATDRTYIVLFDADLQHRPEEIARFLDKLDEGWDIVTGRKVGAYNKRAVSSARPRHTAAHLTARTAWWSQKARTSLVQPGVSSLG